MNIPKKLIILDGAMAMDGGTVSLMGLDRYGNSIEITLDWSIEARKDGAATLYLNKIPIPKRSPEEEKLLDALKNAEIPLSQAQKRNAVTPSRRIVMGDDTKEYIETLDGGPEATLRRLIGQLASNVMSETYTKGNVPKKHLKPSHEFDGPCSVCGKPGYVRQIPGVAVSECFCEDHVPGDTIKPIHIVVALALIFGLIWLIYTYI